MNKIRVLNSLLDTKLQRKVDMGNHVLLLESRFSRLATIGSVMEEQMKVAILISSISMSTEYIAVIASVCTIREEKETWEYVSMIFI